MFIKNILKINTKINFVQHDFKVSFYLTTDLSQRFPKVTTPLMQSITFSYNSASEITILD